MFDWSLLMQNLPLLLDALRVTLEVSIAALAIGFVIGVVIGAMRLSPIPSLRRLGGAYIFVFRGIPLLVQLLFIYYFLPRIGLPNVSPMMAAVVSLSLCAGPTLPRSCAAASLRSLAGSLKRLACWA